MTTISDPRNIQHVVLAHSGDIEEEMRGQVLAEAHANFGYTADSFRARGPLAKILANLEIAPLDSGQVVTYMNSKGGKSEFHPGLWLHVIATLIAVSYVAFGFCHYPSCAQNDGSAFKDYPSGVDWVTVALASIMPAFVGGVLLNGIASFLAHVFFPTTIRARVWATYILGSVNRPYSGYIPVHILNIANLIKKDCPTATFRVHELTESVDELPEPLPDPFLSVSLNGERYFIAVWDEREFEAKM